MLHECVEVWALITHDQQLPGGIVLLTAAAAAPAAVAATTAWGGVGTGQLMN
jgi:hypothetical protein